MCILLSTKWIIQYHYVLMECNTIEKYSFTDDRLGEPDYGILAIDTYVKIKLIFFTLTF